MKKVILWIIGIAVIGGVGMGVLLAVNRADKVAAPVSTPVATTVPSDTPPSQQTTAGRYADYSSEAAKEAGYSSTILFFYAPWCPECRAFDMAIKSGDVPNGVQILKVDYDSSQALRQTYGVTIQTTFVRVDTNGAKQALWTGYGKDKSVSTIIENTK